MGLLFSAPGIQDRVTLRSIFSDNSRAWGGPGISEERPTHECASEQLNTVRYFIMSRWKGQTHPVRWLSRWRCLSRVQCWSHSCRFLCPSSEHLWPSEIHRDLQCTCNHVKNTYVKHQQSQQNMEFINKMQFIQHMTYGFTNTALKLLLYVTFTYSRDCFEQLLANGR